MTFLVRGKFLGFRDKPFTNQKTGQHFVFHEAGVERQIPNGFGGFKTDTEYLKVSDAFHKDVVLISKFSSFIDKVVEVEFYEMSRKGNNGATFYDRYIGKEIELYVPKSVVQK